MDGFSIFMLALCGAATVGLLVSMVVPWILQRRSEREAERATQPILADGFTREYAVSGEVVAGESGWKVYRAGGAAEAVALRRHDLRSDIRRGICRGQPTSHDVRVLATGEELRWSNGTIESA